MIIVTQNKQAVWNFDDVSRLHVTKPGTGIQAVARNGSGGEVAQYRNREQAAIAIEMFYMAAAAGEKVFVFPTQEVFSSAKQHGYTGGGRGHGGS